MSDNQTPFDQTSIVQNPLNQTPIDQAARQRALDITASFAVSAPAGSGKTGLLTQRVLALLAQCDEPENLLAITFTKKAAAEMQSRILAALHHTQAYPEEPEEDYQKITWHLARAVLQRDKARGWELFNCPNRLRITTIDSLCRSLSQQMPFESQLGSTPEILDNPETAYRIAARETLKQLDTPTDLQDHLRLLVKHFDNRLDHVEDLFSKLLSKRDQWLEILLQSAGQRELLETMLTEVIEEQQQATHLALQPFASEIAILADHAANNLQASSSDIKPCLGLVGLPTTTIAGIPQWRGVVELLSTQAGSLRKSVTKATGFLAPTDKSLDTEKKAIAKQYKAQFIELIEQLSADENQHEAIVTALQKIRILPDATYAEPQWELLNSLSHILIHLVQHLTLAFQQLGQADYLAITLAALDALGEPDAPSDTALALDYKIQHILVDEFQDTSTTQLKLLQRLTAGWQADDGRTLFMVGDAMQSCYLFRDANVGIFLDVRKHGLGDIVVEPLDLQVNFRSQQGIVDWVNQRFNTIFPAENNSNVGAVSYKPSVSAHPPLRGHAVKTHLLACEEKPTLRHDEANKVLALIRHHQQQAPSDTIAILVRSKAHAQTIIGELNQANIHYQATDIDRLNTCMPVLDVLSLTKALLYPNDRLAWLSILRAPWCGVDMDDLLRISSYVLDTSHTNDDEPKRRNHSKALLLQSLNHPQAIAQLSEKGQAKVNRFMGVINTALAQQQRVSLRQWIQSIWMSLGGAGLLLDANDTSNIDTFFNLLDKHAQGGVIREWENIEKAVSQLYAKPKAQPITQPKEKAKGDNKDTIPPVEIMTIHKSKGLEFDTVILPALDKKTGMNDKALLLWLERVGYSQQTHRQERQLLISAVNAVGKESDSVYQFIKSQHSEKEQLESDRLLYVACTRAVKYLHLVGYVEVDEPVDSLALNQSLLLDQCKEPNKQSLLYRLWEKNNAAENDNKHSYHQYHITPVTAASPSTKNHHHNRLNHPTIIASLSDQWRPPTVSANTLLAAYRGNNALATLSTDNMAKPDALLQREQRYIGTVIHLALEHITLTDYRTWTAARITQQQPIWEVQLKQQGIPLLRLNHALDTVQEAVTQTLNDPKGQWLLDHNHTDSATELECWDKNGQHIIDRTFITLSNTQARTRWIIDYKSSQPAEDQTLNDFIQQQIKSYQQQLERYKKLFKQEDCETKVALYFVLLRQFIEI